MKTYLEVGGGGGGGLSFRSMSSFYFSGEVAATNIKMFFYIASNMFRLKF